MTNELIAYGVNDMMQGTKLALRSIAFFAFGWHNADAIDDVKAFEGQLRRAILDAGKVKSEASARVKQAKTLGKVFAEKFGAELASEYASEAHRVQACYLAMTASGVTSVKRLMDWAEHGDADYSAKEAERKKAEKADAEAKAMAEERAEREAMADTIVPLSIEDVPEVQILNSEPEADAGPVKRDWSGFVASLDDTEREALREALQASYEEVALAEAV